MKKGIKNNQPFYIGEKVVAVDAVASSHIKNNNVYTISDCYYSYCKGSYYWHVGVLGFHNKWLRPGIFASMHKGLNMKFKELVEDSPIFSN